MSSKHFSLLRLVLAAMFFSLALTLPFLTGQIPEIGGALCPMHLPVLLSGFFCGPWYGLTVGLTAPLVRSLWLGMPPLLTAVAMCFELAAYGFFAGFLYCVLPKRRSSIYLALGSAMLLGRLVWGTVRAVLYGIGLSAFGWQAFLAGAFLEAIPGILLQLVLIPILVMALNRAFPRFAEDSRLGRAGRPSASRKD